MKDQEFVARYVTRNLSAIDLVNFAETKLTSGIYSDRLLEILDAEPKSLAELSVPFEDFILESGGDIPDFERAINELTYYHISRIAAEEVNPIKEFKLLLELISGYDLHSGITEYVGDNIGIHLLIGLYYSIDDLDVPDSRVEYGLNKIKQDMIKECRNWLILNREN
ncbi:hypothetical protein [Pseudoalteromonas ulvae]|uniref:Uncharacterized protein n=1 Tax=Pseudoalteromonas ulvae TaxID=107327 RepID=A0A244CQR0_PSEDV|nr:hypothetical protein [Pseudoalteromonas ulvae]OUL57935.1 hypothetical protein B1199_06090 [Pseudoalteromonas ulvae]